VNEPIPAELARDRFFAAMVLLSAAVVVVSVAALRVGVGDADATNDLANWLQLLVPILAAVSCVLASRRAQVRGWRIGWMLIGVSCALWAVGQGIWTWIETIQGRTVPPVTVADAFYLMSIPVAAIGLLYFPTNLAGRFGRARTVLDGLIVGCAVLFVSWIFVLSPLVSDEGLSGSERVVNLAYPVFDVVLLTIALIALARGGSAGRLPRAFVAAGIIAFAVADSAFAYAALKNGEPTGSTQAGWWIAGYLLIALGALHAMRHPSGQVDVLVADLGEGWAGLFMPIGPVAVVLAISVMQVSLRADQEIDLGSIKIGIVMMALVVIRQAMVILENVQLARSLAQSNEELQFQVLHDPLTGLTNRPLFTDRLRVVLARMTRVDQVAAVMFLDLDRFKPVNDEHGHDAGDAVLAGVATRVAAALRTGDTVARLGGDEFLVLCEAVSGTAEATTLAQRVVDAVAAPLVHDGDELVVSASVGVVITDCPDASPERLIEQADTAMYEAKHRGGGHIELVDERRAGPVDPRRSRPAAQPV
jgi:diguanylate cyclase (GGDEF)-like protein